MGKSDRAAGSSIVTSTGPARKYRICIVIPPHWSYQMGGAQYQAKLLVEKLSQYENVEVLYLARMMSAQAHGNGYRLIKIADDYGIRKYGYWFDHFRLMNLLKDFGPDVIYQRVGCGYTGTCAVYGKKYNCPLVWHIAHDRTLRSMERDITLTYPLRLIDHKFMEYGIRHASKIVAQTENQRSLLRARYNREAILIRNFHPLPQESFKKESSAIVTVVWIANFKPWKRPEEFVRLAEELQELPVRFVMIGKPVANSVWMSAMLSRIETLPNLEYLGEQAQKRVNEMMASADIFVNTSTYEGFANTFIQAWMREVPVLSLTVNPDGVLDGVRTGFCAMDDFGAMKRILIDLVLDTSRRRAIGKSARDYAIERHSERNLDSLVNVLLG